MKVDNDILRSVANDDDKASLLFLDSIANERGDARIPLKVSVLHIFCIQEEFGSYTALRTMSSVLSVL